MNQGDSFSVTQERIILGDQALRHDLSRPPEHRCDRCDVSPRMEYDIRLSDAEVVPKIFYRLLVLTGEDEVPSGTSLIEERHDRSHLDELRLRAEDNVDHGSGEFRFPD